MRLSIIIYAFGVSLIGCNSEPEGNLQNQPEASPSITPEDLIGDWELSRWTVQGEDDKFENDMTLMDLKIWSFSKDSIMITCYPQYLFNHRPFRIEGNTLFYSWDIGSGNEEKYTIEFKGDTLLMTTVSKSVLSSKSSSPIKSQTAFRNYLVRMKVDHDTLISLKSEMVDWSFYQRRWVYHSSLCVEPFDPPNADSIAVPITIDLTAENASNYSFYKNSLKYFDRKTKQVYYLNFRGHGHTNHELSKLILGAYTADSSQLHSIRYEVEK